MGEEFNWGGVGVGGGRGQVVVVFIVVQMVWFYCSRRFCFFFSWVFSFSLQGFYFYYSVFQSFCLCLYLERFIEVCGYWMVFFQILFQVVSYGVKIGRFCFVKIVVFMVIVCDIFGKVICRIIELEGGDGVGVGDGEGRFQVGVGRCCIYMFFFVFFVVSYFSVQVQLGQMFFE